MSSITAVVSRIRASAVVPTLPRVQMIRLVDTARRCWHWEADRLVESAAVVWFDRDLPVELSQR